MKLFVSPHKKVFGHVYALVAQKRWKDPAFKKRMLTLMPRGKAAKNFGGAL